jgi:hypothetical protein
MRHPTIIKDLGAGGSRPTWTLLARLIAMRELSPWTVLTVGTGFVLSAPP